MTDRKKIWLARKRGYEEGYEAGKAEGGGTTELPSQTELIYSNIFLVQNTNSNGKLTINARDKELFDRIVDFHARDPYFAEKYFTEIGCEIAGLGGMHALVLHVNGGFDDGTDELVFVKFQCGIAEDPDYGFSEVDYNVSTGEFTAVKLNYNGTDITAVAQANLEGLAFIINAPYSVVEDLVK